uniref:acireductone dioxygenase (Fe(2+)-requiring) n=1 Tax=Meloidogyne javanica TaxID=6303 RepID=A0A915LI86_MELJA
MVMCWLMADGIVDKHEKCHRNPPVFVGPRALHKLGIQYFYIPVENSEKGLSSVAMSRGYDYKDEVVITRETMADYDEWLKRFFEEHFHPEGYIKAIRMFKGNPKWVAHNRKDPKTERMEIRKNYLTKLNKYTNQEVLTTIY